MSTFAYQCELCPAKVPLTAAEYDARRGRVRCDDCSARQRRVTTARKLTEFAADRALRRPTCEKCGSARPVKHVRLDPRNYHEEHALLCTRCGEKLGFRPVTFHRWSAAEHGRYGTAA